MASTYITHTDVEPLLLDGTTELSSSTTPTDALVDALCEQAERLAEAAIYDEGYTLANANTNSSAGLKGVLIQIVQWLLDDWYRRQQAGGAQSVSDTEGTLSFQQARELPARFRTALLRLVKKRPTIRTFDLLPDN